MKGGSNSIASLNFMEHNQAISLNRVNLTRAPVDTIGLYITYSSICLSFMSKGSQGF